MQNLKPKQTAKELIKMMKEDKGIGFSLISESEAEQYLLYENNYLRTASYRANYQKYQRGPNEGKYIGLEFEYLRELSAIDHAFRECVFSLCIDIEHDLKVKLVRDIENDTNEDGYSIVKSFIKNNPSILKRIAATANSPFTHDLMIKYLDITTTVNNNTGEVWVDVHSADRCPIWVFVEFITFGDFINLYRHYYYKEYDLLTAKAEAQNTPVERLTHYEKRKDILSYKILNSVRTLRNGCAHNNCTLASLTRGKTSPLAIISQAAASPEIGRKQLHNKLSSRPMYEFASLLFSYKYIDKYCNSHESINTLLYLFNRRMLQHKEYFQNNDLIKGNYRFALHLIQNILPEKWAACNMSNGNIVTSKGGLWNRIKSFFKCI